MSLFNQLGDITAVKQLADTFYDVMDRDPDFHDLRLLHPLKLLTTKKKLFRVLNHWLGGPKQLTPMPPSIARLELRHRNIDLNDYHAAL